MFNNRVLQNTKWIIVCKIIQSLVQLVVGMLSARYLGPANYGLINYAASLVAFAVPVMQLGLQATLVQEYVNDPDKEGEIVGTSLVMNGVSAVACMAGVVTFTAFANAGETVTILVCGLYSTSLLCQSFEMLQYWFQAKLLSKYSAPAMLCAYIVASAYKIYLLATAKNIYWFAVSHSIEYGVTGLVLFVTYLKRGQQKLSFSCQTAKRLFGKSRHYIAAMLMVVVYTSMGNVMLKMMVGEAENGYYAAAATCVSISNFVFMAIIDTARPVALQSREISVEQFEKNVSRVYAITTYLALAQSVVYTLFAEFIIKVLYDDAYSPAAPVLRILVWNTAFSYMGYVRNIWILGEEKHKSLFAINFGGAVANLVFNIWLIPGLGAQGAAYASVLTQIFTNFVMGFVLKPIRRNNVLILRGVHPKCIWETVKLLVDSLRGEKVAVDEKE